MGYALIAGCHPGYPRNPTLFRAPGSQLGVRLRECCVDIVPLEEWTGCCSSGAGTTTAFGLGPGRSTMGRGVLLADLCVFELERSPLGKPGQAIVGYRFPRGSVCGVHPGGRPNPGVSIEASEPYALHLWILRVATPEGTPTDSTEVLRETVSRLIAANELLAGGNPERPSG
jgi:hypothetical protein